MNESDQKMRNKEAARQRMKLIDEMKKSRPERERLRAQKAHEEGLKTFLDLVLDSYNNHHKPDVESSGIHAKAKLGVFCADNMRDISPLVGKRMESFAYLIEKTSELKGEPADARTPHLVSLLQRCFEVWASELIYQCNPDAVVYYFIRQSSDGGAIAAYSVQYQTSERNQTHGEILFREGDKPAAFLPHYHLTGAEAIHDGIVDFYQRVLPRNKLAMAVQASAMEDAKRVRGSLTDELIRVIHH